MGRRKSIPPPAAVAATTAPSPSAVAATTAAAVLFRLGLVDGEAPTAHLLTVHAGDGGLSLGVAAHLDEAEALGASGIAVHDHLRRLHRPELDEHALQGAGVHIVGQVAHVQLLTHRIILEKGSRARRWPGWPRVAWCD